LDPKGILKMKKLFINAPILSRSGYGEMARFALRALRQHEDKFDIYLNALNWGQTGFLFEENEEFNYINSLRVKTENYIRQQNGAPQFDISLQITIPNEWKKMAPINIGYTAGIETNFISPAWLEPSNQMDKIIVISEHAKKVYQNTMFEDAAGNKFKVNTPVEVVHFPWEQIENASINLDLEPQFNFLTVNQWGPRKNIEELVGAFIEEFREEDVGLVIKSNRANDSIGDKNILERHVNELVKSKGAKKCKVYLVHGTLTEAEMHGIYRHPKIKAFVTCTHGEGFGLPIFEAVNEELPVIATNWSGHLDFLSAPDKDGDVKPLFAKVDFELKPVQEQFVWPGVTEKGTSWAYPSVSSLKSRMREVYKDHSRFKAWARKVSEHNKQKFEKQKVYDSFVEKILGKTNNDTVIL
jgi:glycosyltransferase involved in cell wall biosynthesis